MRTAIIVTGSRDWTDGQAVIGVLERYYCEEPDRVVLIHGDARGADTWADKAAGTHWFDVVAMPAQWDRDGKAAGAIRNVEMLKVLIALRNCGYTVAVHAFSLPHSKGTRHMKNAAKAHGVEVFEHGRTE